VNTVERRGRRLLRAYPAAYRAERGDEILDTLLESARDNRIGRREAWALVAGGLRVRAGQHRRLTTAANLRLATLYGFVLWIVLAASNELWLVALPREESNTYLDGHLESSTVTWNYEPVWPLIFHLVTGTALLALVVAAWFARPRIILALGAVAAAGVLPWHWEGSPTMLLIIASSVVLSRGAARMPRSWLWPLALLTVGRVLVNAWFPLGLPMLPALLMWIALGSILLWTFFDGRPLFGLGVFVAVIVGLSQVTALTRPGGSSAGPLWEMLVVPGIGLAFMLPGLLRIRRQAVL